MDCEEVKENLFGGFCNCGSVMRQRFWAKSDELEILIFECEKCWKNEALIFKNRTYINRIPVKTRKD
ncbi:MAG: hypothetical protein NZ895_05005 [Archaeoglobaceae archaeon]|nr:hypothetical protein [Archaeoglobaceae archaeon]MCX8152743.1 hypothetical protein [Archaeoglobaceae archaeon]MDW8013450.1 hypothetical protein [Archaeoglobaceae archaeon]